MSGDSNKSSKVVLIQSSLTTQLKNYKEWFRADLYLLNQYQLIQSFRKNDPLSMWQGKDFVECSASDYQLLGIWGSPQHRSTEEGLELQQYIIRAPCNLNLRSLAIELKITAKLGFHSSLIIFTRVVDKIAGNTPVLKLVKDTNLKGLFFVFGYIDTDTNTFRFIKMQQLTDLLFNTEPYRELEIRVMDNGTDKIFVRISSAGLEKCIEDFHFCCSGFVPEFRDSQVWVAGAGDRVYLNSLSVQYKERIFSSASKRTSECVCNIN